MGVKGRADGWLVADSQSVCAEEMSSYQHVQVARLVAAIRAADKHYKDTGELVKTVDVSHSEASGPFGRGHYIQWGFNSAGIGRFIEKKDGEEWDNFKKLAVVVPLVSATIFLDKPREKEGGEEGGEGGGGEVEKKGGGASLYFYVNSSQAGKDFVDLQCLVREKIQNYVSAALSGKYAIKEGITPSGGVRAYISDGVFEKLVRGGDDAESVKVSLEDAVKCIGQYEERGDDAQYSVSLLLSPGRRGLAREGAARFGWEALSVLIVPMAFVPGAEERQREQHKRTLSEMIGSGSLCTGAVEEEKKKRENGCDKRVRADAPKKKKE